MIGWEKENTCMFFLTHLSTLAHGLILEAIFYPCYNSRISIKK